MSRLTATEAALLSEDACELKRSSIERILKMIEEAAIKGERCIYLSFLSSESFNELIKLGYEITVKKLYTISW